MKGLARCCITPAQGALLSLVLSVGMVPTCELLAALSPLDDLWQAPLTPLIKARESLIHVFAGQDETAVLVGLIFRFVKPQ